MNLQRRRSGRLHSDRLPGLAMAGVLAVILALSGCSTTTGDAAPGTWFEAAVETISNLFSGDSGPDVADYPSLSDVPEIADDAGSPEERAAMQERLVADREGVRRSTLWPRVPPPGNDEAVGTSLAMSDPADSPELTASTQPDEPESVPPPVETEATGPDDAPAPSEISGQPAPVSETPDRTSSADSPRAGAAPGGERVSSETPSDATAVDTAATSAPVASASPVPSRFDLRPALGLPAAEPAAATPPQASQPLKFDLFSAEPGAENVLLFGHGSAEPSPEDMATLEILAARAMQAGARLRVVGHASIRTRDLDPIEHTLVNFMMSLHRANAVAAALRASGMPADRVSVTAVGATQPRYSEAMPSGEAGNRRVEVFIES